MAYQTLANFNTTGLSSLIVYVSVITNNLFPKLLLAFIWVIFTFGSFFIQKNTTGMGDFTQSLAVGGFFLAITAIYLRIIDTGITNYYLISGSVLAICLVISGISVVFFLFSQDY